ncbi:MAG TPA: hypothetical protein PLQ93_03080 [Bacteroidia bacterium]|nr:hypothetical protein [Bacteroidia bacterium]
MSAGPSGYSGPQGLSGMISTDFISGLGANPTGTVIFLTPYITVVITSTAQHVFWVSTKVMGSTMSGGAGNLNIYPGFKLSTAANITPIGAGMYGLACLQNTRQVLTISASVNGLSPGTYYFGMAGVSTSSTDWNWNEYGYVSYILMN